MRRYLPIDLGFRVLLINRGTDRNQPVRHETYEAKEDERMAHTTLPPTAERTAIDQRHRQHQAQQGGR